MHESPFEIFDQFSNHIRVRFLDKHDNVFSDEDTARSLEIPLENLITVKQVHGPKTVRVESPTRNVFDADGMVTNQKKIALAVRSADCQTFVFFDPDHDAIGALHVGWRGLLAGAIEEHVQTFVREWGSDPGALVVGAAPSLCQMSADFTNPREELPGIDEKFFSKNCVDLLGIADEKLQKIGIKSEHVERMQGCTRCSPGQWWSYRGPDREEVRKGARNVLSIELF